MKSKLFLVSILVADYFFLVTKQTFSSVSTEASIKSAIFQQNTYDKTLRPNFTTNIFLEYTLKQLTAVDDKTQAITTCSYLFITWTDSRLNWTVSDYDGVERIPVKN